MRLPLRLGRFSGLAPRNLRHCSPFSALRTALGDDRLVLFFRLLLVAICFFRVVVPFALFR